MKKRHRKPNSVELLMADIMTITYEAMAYFAAFAGPTYMLHTCRRLHPLILLTMGLVGWFVAAMVFATFLILTKRIFIGEAGFGRFFLTSKKAVRWMIADRIVKIMLRSPFRALVTENAILRLLWHRGMGTRMDGTLLMGNGAKMTEPWAVRIGRNVIIGDGSVLSGHKVERNLVTLGTVEIGDNVVVGANSIVFPGVTIGKDAVIGAGSVVTRGMIIPPGETWSGHPAQKVDLCSELAIYQESQLGETVSEPRRHSSPEALHDRPYDYVPPGGGHSAACVVTEEIPA